MSSLTLVALRAQTYSFRGRLAARPEVRFFESGTCVANAKIAVDLPDKKGRDDDRQPDWLKIEIWGDDAQKFADGLEKGQLVDVSGRLKSESWTDRNTGEQREQLVIRVHSWSPVQTNRPPAGSGAAPAAQPQQTAAGAPPVWNSKPIDNSGFDDEEVPF